MIAQRDAFPSKWGPEQICDGQFGDTTSDVNRTRDAIENFENRRGLFGRGQNSSDGTLAITSARDLTGVVMFEVLGMEAPPSPLQR